MTKIETTENVFKILKGKLTDGIILLARNLNK